MFYWKIQALFLQEISNKVNWVLYQSLIWDFNHYHSITVMIMFSTMEGTLVDALDVIKMDSLKMKEFYV